MTDWEIEKAASLLTTARQIGMNIRGYGELAVNQSSGYTYLWLEDYPFCLYLPISFEGEVRDNIWVQWSDPMNGEEEEMLLTDFETEGDNTLTKILYWCNELDIINRID